MTLNFEITDELVKEYFNTRDKFVLIIEHIGIGVHEYDNSSELAGEVDAFEIAVDLQATILYHKNQIAMHTRKLKNLMEK